MNALFRLLNTLSLDELVLVGKLDIFSNEKWKEYWAVCNVKTISIQDRLRTRGFVNFMKSHGNNTNTSCLILKREFTLNDLFYFYHYLLKNETVKDLQLTFMDSIAKDNNSAYFFSTISGKVKQPQILVTADRMELTGLLYKPLGLLANNKTLKCTLFINN